LALNRLFSSETPKGVWLAIVKETAIERLATLLEHEVALEAIARELPPGTERDELLAALEKLRALIKTLQAK
jgi:hypothetical protein